MSSYLLRAHQLNGLCKCNAYPLCLKVNVQHPRFSIINTPCGCVLLPLGNSLIPKPSGNEVTITARSTCHNLLNYVSNFYHEYIIVTSLILYT